MSRFPFPGLIIMFALAACEPNSSPEPPADTATAVSWHRKAWIRRRLRSWMKNSAPESTVTLIPC
jgi:hypothetical protein